MARNKPGGSGQWFHVKLSHKEAVALYEHCDQQDMSPEALLRHAFITYDTVMKTPGALEAISKLTREMTGPKVLIDHPSAPPCTCKFINEPNAAGMSTDPNCPQHGYLLVRSTQETFSEPVEGVVRGSGLEQQIQAARKAIAAWPDDVKRAMKVQG